MKHKILLLSGDGIGPEIMVQAKRLLNWAIDERGHLFEIVEHPIGNASIALHGCFLADLIAHLISAMLTIPIDMLPLAFLSPADKQQAATCALSFKPQCNL